MRITVIEPEGDPTTLEVAPKPVRIVVRGRGAQGPAAEGIGDISDLETEDKTSLVAAINELNMDGVSLAILYDNAKAG